uniref:Uncharacterized protein n=1 Tax=Anguilla anguilla TaxID=7936 RepID=A0A0E9PJU1_ANGAN
MGQRFLERSRPQLILLTMVEIYPRNDNSYGGKLRLRLRNVKSCVTFSLLDIYIITYGSSEASSLFPQCNYHLK